MSYSISKTNYFINASSFGNNRTQRASIDFGIYEPSTEATTEPSFETRVLEGPQVVFGETTDTNPSGRITAPSEVDILQSTGIQQPEIPLQDSIVDALTYFSPARRRTRTATGFASTASGRSRN